MSSKDRVQDINLNQLELKVNYSNNEDEKLKTEFGFVNVEDVINKGCLDTKLAEVKGYILYIEKNCNQYRNHERSNEEFSYERAVKITIQILFPKKIPDKCDNLDEVPKSYPITERRRLDLDELNVDIIR